MGCAWGWMLGQRLQPLGQEALSLGRWAKKGLDQINSDLLSTF